MDNASSDGSYFAAQQRFQLEPDFQFHSNTENIGFAAGVNSVIGRARGDYILVLNPDCMMPRNGFVEFIRVMEASPSVGVSGPLVLNGDGTVQRSCRRDIPSPKKALMQISGLCRMFPDSEWFSGFEVLPSTPVPESPKEVEGCTPSAQVGQTSLIA